LKAIQVAEDVGQAGAAADLHISDGNHLTLEIRIVMIAETLVFMLF
jgi:hypothetical protein